MNTNLIFRILAIISLTGIFGYNMYLGDVRNEKQAVVIKTQKRQIDSLKAELQKPKPVSTSGDNSPAVVGSEVNISYP